MGEAFGRAGWGRAPTGEDQVKELADRLEQAALETAFSGVISVFRDGSTLFSKAFGYRDIKNKLPNTTSTIFGIASGTKVFTRWELAC